MGGGVEFLQIRKLFYLKYIFGVASQRQRIGLESCTLVDELELVDVRVGNVGEMGAIAVECIPVVGTGLGGVFGRRTSAWLDALL